jgi:hypothetical protein
MTAQTEPASDVSGERVITAINMTAMRALLASYGHTVIGEMPDENGVTMRAPNGFEYILLLKRCDERAVCQGILIGTIHPIPEGATWELLNQADSRVDLVGLYVMNDRLIMDRYIALPGGIRLDQVRHEIATLAQIVPPLLAEITQQAAQNQG